MDKSGMMKSVKTAKINPNNTREKYEQPLIIYKVKSKCRKKYISGAKNNHYRR